MCESWLPLLYQDASLSFYEAGSCHWYWQGARERRRTRETSDEGGSHYTALHPSSVPHPPLFFIFLLHVPHRLVLTRALWLSLGPMTPCGRWEDHNSDQGRSRRRAVPSRKTDSEREKKKLWAPLCLKEAAGICSDGLCSLELLLKLDGGSSQKEEKGREVNPVLQHALRLCRTTSWDGFNNLLWETSVTGEVVTSLT